MAQPHDEASLAEQVLQVAPVIALRLGPDGVVQQVNAYFEQLTGWPLDEVRGRNWFDHFVPADERESVRALLRAAAPGSSIQGNVSSVLTRSGRVLKVEWHDRVLVGPDGRSAGLLGIGRDVTDQQRAVEQLRRSEERLRHFFEAGLVGMAITVMDKGWGQFNQRLCEILGRSEDELRRLTWADVTHPDDLPGDLAQFERLVRGEADHYTLDKRFVRPDGELVHAAIAVRCDRDAQGRPRRFFATVADITQRKRAEAELARHRELLESQVAERTRELVAARDEAQRANRAKSEFLSRMSHELRTPMNAVLGFGQLMLLDPHLDRRHHGYVNEQLRAGRHLLDLINEVLDLSHIESGQVALAPAPLPLDELAGECLRMIEPLAAQRPVQLQALPMPGLVVQADRVRLRQVLLNLLSNAVKYNRPNGSVTVSARRDAEAVRVEVLDTGPGMPPQRLGELFQPFQRLGAEDGGVEGTGIGLSIARHLVTMMGGTIGCDSEPGVGSCFWLRLPAAEA